MVGGGRAVKSGVDKMEGDALGERLLNQLANYITGDLTVVDFDIVPVEVNHSNKSPVILDRRHLGVESWCVKYILDYAYNRLMDDHFSKAHAKRITQNNCDRINRLTMTVLLFNPDVMTFWNKRREMVVKEFLDIDNELKFTKLVLTHKPKSNEVFNYRKWLLQRAFSKTETFFVYLLRDVIGEFAVAGNCAERCPNNYHAWSHRIWLLKLLGELPRFRAQRSIRSQYAHELLRAELWTAAHVTDYSGIHYKQFCLNNALEMLDFFEFVPTQRDKVVVALRKFLVQNLPGCELIPFDDDKRMVDTFLGTTASNFEADKYIGTFKNMCILVHELMVNEHDSELFASHETLWCHRKYAMQKLMSLLYDYFGESKPKANHLLSALNEQCKSGDDVGNITDALVDDAYISFDSAILEKEPKISRFDNHSTYNCPLYKALAVNERRYIDQRLMASDKCAKKYEVWLRVILKFSF